MEKLPEGVFIAKWLLYFNGYPQRYVFKPSGQRFELNEDELPEGVKPECQFVIIGRDLYIPELRRMLERYQVPSECVQKRRVKNRQFLRHPVVFFGKSHQKD